MHNKPMVDEILPPSHDGGLLLDRVARSPAKTVEQLHAELRRSEQRYRDLLQALPIAAYTTDAAGTIAMFNDAAVGLWGRAPERGRKWCGSARLFTPDGEELAPDASPMAVTIRERRTQSQIEIIVGRSDGSRRNVLAHPQLLHDEDGQPTGAVNFLVNVTGQCRAEAELTLEVETLTRLHELSAVRLAPAPELRDSLQGVLTALVALHGADFGLLSLFDPEAGTLRDAASIGLDAEALEMLGTVVPTRGVGACGRAFVEGVRVVVDDVENDPAFECDRAAASAIGFRAVHSTPIITRSGEILGVLSVHFRSPHRPSARHMQIADICAREAADTVAAIRQLQILQQTDRRKDEFLATLAHELRNPLAAMRYSLDVLHIDGVATPTVACAHAALDRQLAQMVRLVDDLLDVGRLSSGRIELRRELVDLVDVVRSAIETSSSLIAQGGHELTVVLPTTPVLVDGDPTRLAQVFVNLLGNAAKYTPAHGRVTVELAREGVEAVVRVRDDGIGIAPEQLPDLFAMLTRVDGSRQRADGGLGVGLGIARRLVEVHGGTILAHSDGLGRGSEFEVRVPISEGRHPFADDESEDGSPTAPVRRLRVVVADDNEDAAAGLELLLEAMGHEVHVAHDGVDAVELAERIHPDAIVLDIGMPRLSGLEACRAIRQQAWASDAVIVALTGWGQAEDLRRSFDAGFDHHIVKPCDRTSLTVMLEHGRR